MADVPSTTAERLPSVPDSDYAILKHAAEFQAVMQKNLGGQGIGGPFGLDRVRVPTGGATVWAVPTLDGEEYKEIIEGIIIYQRPGRSFWKESFEEKTAAGPPDCQSDDLIMGIGDPGGLCKNCPYGQWGSHPRGAGKACRDTNMLFLIREDEVLPLLIVAPPTSLRAVRDYLKRLTSRLIPYEAVVTRFELEKDTSDSGIAYAKIKPGLVARLTDEEATAMAKVAGFYEPFLAAERIERADTDI